MALAKGYSKEVTVSAGLLVSAAVLLLSVSGLLRCFTASIPIPVVKGIQVGAGLSLIVSAGTSLLGPSRADPGWNDNIYWSAFAFILLLVSLRRPLFPSALVIFVVGFTIALVVSGGGFGQVGVWHPEFFVPSSLDFRSGLDAALGQLPLTTLNSVIAVSYLSADLFPDFPMPTVTKMGVSVGLMNLSGAWFGCMPVCHGSGGLAAQYRFGARSGASIIVLGLVKVVLGLCFGDAFMNIVRLYPKSILGIMVLAAGLELAKVGESLNTDARDLWEESNPLDGDSAQDKRCRSLTDEERSQRSHVMLTTVGVMLAFKNDAVGFAAGMLCHWIYHPLRVGRWLQRQKATRDTERELLLSP